MTPAELREVLANSPLDPGPMAPDMTGWDMGEFSVCMVCAGRITGRGCGYMLRGGRPVYDVPVVCAVCGPGGA